MQINDKFSYYFDYSDNSTEKGLFTAAKWLSESSSVTKGDLESPNICELK